MASPGTEATPMSDKHDDNVHPRRDDGHAITRISSLCLLGSSPYTCHDNSQKQQQTQQQAHEDQVLTYTGDASASIGENSHARASDGNTMPRLIASSYRDTLADTIPTTTTTKPASHPPHNKGSCHHSLSSSMCADGGNNNGNHNHNGNDKHQGNGNSTAHGDEHDFFASAENAPLRAVHHQGRSSSQEGIIAQDVQQQHDHRSGSADTDAAVANGNRDYEVIADLRALPLNKRNVHGPSDLHREVVPGPSTVSNNKPNDYPSHSHSQDPQRSSSIDSSKLEFFATTALNLVKSLTNQRNITTPSISTAPIPRLPRPKPDAPPLRPRPRPRPSSTTPAKPPLLFHPYAPTVSPSTIPLKPFTFTEVEDNALMDFWFKNFQIFKSSSKLAFARFATGEMNLMFAFRGSGRAETHEKQVHNKMSYLLRRYERMLSKYAGLKEGYQIQAAAFNEEVRRVIVPRFKVINCEFHAFSKMYEFLSRCRYDPRCHPSQGFHQPSSFVGEKWQWKGYGPRSSENQKQHAQGLVHASRSSGNQTQAQRYVQGSASGNQRRHSVGEITGAGDGDTGLGMKRKRNDEEEEGDENNAFNHSSPGSSSDIDNPAKRVCATGNALPILNQNNSQHGDSEEGQKNIRDERITGSIDNGMQVMQPDEMQAVDLSASLLKACAEQEKEDARREAIEEQEGDASSRCEQVHGTTQGQEVVMTASDQEESGGLSTARSGSGSGSGSRVGRPSAVMGHPAVAVGVQSSRSTATPQLTDGGAVADTGYYGHSSWHDTHPVDHQTGHRHAHPHPIEPRTSSLQQHGNYQPAKWGLPDVQEPPPYQSSYSHPATSNTTGANHSAKVDQGQIRLAPLIINDGAGSHSNKVNRSGNNSVYTNGDQYVQPQTQDTKDPKSSNDGSPRDEHVQRGDTVCSKSPAPSSSPSPPPDVHPAPAMSGGILAQHLPYRVGSSTRDSCPLYNADQESGHGHGNTQPDQVHNNQYVDKTNHHCSAEGCAPRQPSVAGTAAAAAAPQPVAPDRITSIPASAAPDDDAAHENCVPPHRSAAAPDHTRALVSSNYQSNTQPNGDEHNGGDAHHGSPDDDVVVGGSGGNTANDDANHFNGAPPHDGNNSEGSDESGDNVMMAVVNRAKFLMKKAELVLRKEELEIRKKELELRKKELVINIRSNEGERQHSCARMYIDLNMRAEAADCVKKVVQLSDANIESVNRE